MTYQQVGERFGITVNTVKTMYYRALKQLKEELGGNAVVLFFILYTEAKAYIFLQMQSYF